MGAAFILLNRREAGPVPAQSALSFTVRARGGSSDVAATTDAPAPAKPARAPAKGRAAKVAPK